MGCCRSDSMLSKITILTTGPGWCNRGIRCVLQEGTLRLQYLCRGRGTRSVSGLVFGPWATLEDQDTHPRPMVSGHTAIGINVILGLRRTKARRTVSTSCPACGYQHARARGRIIQRLGNLAQHQRLMLSKLVWAILDLTTLPRLDRRLRVRNSHLSTSGTSQTMVCALSMVTLHIARRF